MANRPQINNTLRTMLRSRITAHPQGKELLGPDHHNANTDELMSAANILELDLPTAAQEARYTSLKAMKIGGQSISGQLANKVVNYELRALNEGGDGMHDLARGAFVSFREAYQQVEKKAGAVARKAAKNQKTSSQAPTKVAGVTVESLTSDILGNRAAPTPEPSTQPMPAAAIQDSMEAYATRTLRSIGEGGIVEVTVRHPGGVYTVVKHQPD